MTTIFAARRILTMSPSRPDATHVAVRDGLILGVGSLEELRGWGHSELDDRFADKVLMPGFVEGHTHLDAGAVWAHTYCGYYERIRPDGARCPAVRTLEEVIARLAESASRAKHGKAIIGWCFDPLFMGVGLTRVELDRVSTTQPVVVIHASGHVLYANTVALRQAGYYEPAFRHDGLPLGTDGVPTGELKGVEVALPAAHALGIVDVMVCRDVAAARAFGKLCVRAGVTTATDLANPLDEHGYEVLAKATGAADFPARIVAAIMGAGQPPVEAVDRARQLRSRSTDRLRLGMIKLVLDGSIQAFTARLLEPGYYNGAPNGLWYMAPEQVREYLELALAANLQVHMHTNGDQATELALDCLEAALRRHPHPDHRYTLQHAQLSNAAQFMRIKQLGACANLFANHIFYYGDVHAAHTVGPERAARMNACGTALRLGVPFAMHSDEPVTPMAPLFTAWCAVNRLTASGQVLGPEQRIGVMDALHAMTLGTAYTLHLDHEIGSIEAGKRADFAVLEEDPTRVAPERLKDVGVWGTVLGGRPCAAIL